MSLSLTLQLAKEKDCKSYVFIMYNEYISVLIELYTVKTHIYYTYVD